MAVKNRGFIFIFFVAAETDKIFSDHYSILRINAGIYGLKVKYGMEQNILLYFC